MNKLHRRMAVVFMALVIVVGLASSASGLLVDMAGHWAGPLMAALEAKGIVAGDETGRLDPDAPLTRAQLAKLFVVGLGNEADAQLLARYDSRFTDIPGWHWAKGYIESLAEMAVTDGYPDGAFGPGDTVTRAQMAVFLVRVMGLQDEAWRQQQAVTSFADDHDIPGWARGSVQVAMANGLMNGVSSDLFRPLQPITKAEGGVALLRLLGKLGRAYDLVGTLLSFDPNTLQGTVRDQLGQTRTFVMSAGAQYYRGGVATQISQIQTADQIWIVYGKDGKAAFMEARYKDLLGTGAVVQGEKITVVGPDRISQTFTLQPGAAIFLNGKSATLPQLQGVPQVYLALDSETGEVRAADGVDAPLSGRITSVKQSPPALDVNLVTKVQRLPLAPDAILFLNGSGAAITDLRVGDNVQIAVNDAGAITYLQAVR